MQSRNIRFISIQGPIRVERLFVFPIKSCAGFEVKSWEVDGMGLRFDREWALVDGNGFYINQKRVPKLCVVRPIIDISYPNPSSAKLHLNLNRSGFMHIEAPGTTKLSVPLYQSASWTETDVDEELSLRICGDSCSGYAYGKGVTEWFSKVTGIT